MDETKQILRHRSLLINSQKVEINKLFAREINRHYKRTVPVNSSKSTKPSNQNLDLELKLAKNNSSQLKSHKKHQSLELQSISNIKTGRNSAEPSKVSTNSKKSPDSKHYLIQTKCEFFRKPENFCLNETCKRILKKFSGFFEGISQINKKNNFVAPRKAPRCREVNEFEVVLREEYRKDRINMRNLGATVGTRKRLWRPDCAKVLRKVEKVLASIPSVKIL